METAIVDPKVDLVFKSLFGTEDNKDLLLSLTNAAIAPEAPLVEVDLLETMQMPDYPDEKMGIVDVRCRDADGRSFIIEMQCANHPAFRRRLLYYWARLYSIQLKRGDYYTELNPVIVIVFTNFRMHGDRRVVHRYQVIDAESGRELSDVLSIQLFELPNHEVLPEQATTLLQRWLSFLKEYHESQDGRVLANARVQESLCRAHALERRRRVSA